MKVMFLGDTHANTDFVVEAFEYAASHDARAIIQVGDFGWWPAIAPGAYFISRVSDLATSYSIPFYFVDGNHEDHSSLPHDDSIPLPPRPPIEMRKNLWWLHRGCLLELGGSRILAFGGAHSVDAHLRVEGKSWFPTEVATWGQQDLFERPCQPDIIVTHDAPDGVPLTLTYPVTEAVHARSLAHREYLRSVLDYHRPDYWFAGHYHQRVFHTIGTTEVHVLAHDALALSLSAYVLDI